MATVIREADGMEEIRALTALMAEVWGESFLDPGICRATQHAGGYLTGAWEGERLVGASMAFVGWLDGEVLLHSHATCTAPGLGSRGIGPALKWHQRRWALDRGIRRIEWTYDPLVARNGWFNLTKLGARGVEYVVDFYGRMTTAIERGDESDRFLVRWDLDDARVVAAAAGDLVAADVDALRAAGAPVLVSVGDDGGPVVGRSPRRRPGPRPGRPRHRVPPGHPPGDRRPLAHRPPRDHGPRHARRPPPRRRRPGRLVPPGAHLGPKPMQGWGRWGRAEGRPGA